MRYVYNMVQKYVKGKTKQANKELCTILYMKDMFLLPGPWSAAVGPALG